MNRPSFFHQCLKMSCRHFLSVLFLQFISHKINIYSMSFDKDLIPSWHLPFSYKIVDFKYVFVLLNNCSVLYWTIVNRMNMETIITWYCVQKDCFPKTPTFLFHSFVHVLNLNNVCVSECSASLSKLKNKYVKHVKNAQNVQIVDFPYILFLHVSYFITQY